MEDLVTRQEFEELKQSLQVIGDGQTISVQQSAGGQLIESLMAPAAPAGTDGDTAPEFVTVAYDSDNEIFEISINSLPFFHVGASETYQRNSSYEIKEFSTGDNGSTVLKFEKPATGNIEVKLQIEYGRQRGYGDIYYVTWSSLTATTTDSYTLTREKDSGTVGDIGVFQTVQLSSSGGIVKGLQDIAPIAMCPGTNVSTPMLWWDSGTLYLQDFYDPSLTTSVLNTISKAGIGGGTDDKVIIGFDLDVGTYKLDIYANRTTYDRHFIIGQIKVVTISAQDFPTQCYLHMTQSPEFGFSGNDVIREWRPDGGVFNATHQSRTTTKTYQNGRILKTVSTDWVQVDYSGQLGV